LIFISFIQKIIY